MARRAIPCARDSAHVYRKTSPLPDPAPVLATSRIPAARDTPSALAAASTRFRSSGEKRIIAASLLSFSRLGGAAARDEARPHPDGSAASLR
jgi:hypothetical protein